MRLSEITYTDKRQLNNTHIQILQHMDLVLSPEMQHSPFRQNNHINNSNFYYTGLDIDLSVGVGVSLTSAE